ncbi:preprotein translocase subunit SecE [Bailinhaonella thermotolerans]|uniref:Protein translocase subunit SecE n=1 Tax=Bailinhaonella thermotolerans TaxID=1070861 RepID=A0A3A4B9B8_9ACTN|nr:preprotein translocase subunit SecE [Bailinhaonella thermotolerans]RJL30758.1 preprotein translocase subunit SecE [Bailinhaonella thermotolerans]
MATQTRGATADRPEQPTPKKKRTSPATFYRQVVAELRKVIWPTRKELVTYTTVALIFVLIMVGLVSGLDFLFSQGILKVFGSG